MAMIDDLVEAVARAGRLPPDQAVLAVDGMLRFLAARLPSPLFGELQARLQVTTTPDPSAAPSTGPSDATAPTPRTP
ncbi:hypothetical protein [Aquabacterium sp.]|uniref:hypothetical protein n=1 Tax=Aquabacterium sp. TaxID=1872578 RepID=UPI002C7870AE|nr:hypothetical protein [Aquabacterium sp.]HSW07722.1 hypothetical protein [Aquabacterium sp.]